jgi:hypothetical protein
MNVFKEALEGHPLIALEKIYDTVLGVLPAPIAAMVKKITSDEFPVVVDAVSTVAQDVIAGGLSTASFVKAALDAEQILIGKGLTVARTDIFAALNLQVSQLQAAAATAQPQTEPTPAS